MSTDHAKIATLVHHWIEHNDGHRQSYLDWLTKLEDADLPATKAALLEVAALTDRANEALRRAQTELTGSGAAADEAPHDHEHSHAHDHGCGHGHGRGHGQGHGHGHGHACGHGHGRGHGHGHTH